MGRPRKIEKREKFTTTILEDILQKTKEKAVKERRDINAILEELLIKYYL